MENCGRCGGLWEITELWERCGIVGNNRIVGKKESMGENGGWWDRVEDLGMQQGTVGKS